ncbi:mitosis initiation protein fs(1)Ya [Wyeomyia smithii]|uniref:mitosis initiation protein fs(1)Ya n=1 Tax=Wyeomyia smithii TaxID=174621 RepID=UPI00246806DC|nr:mitosis initiation protein fs(1)Ya [Wyeomyia smithii]
MKIPKEVQCRTCAQVFCCAKCREKHENNNHKEMQAIRQICYICNNRPFPLKPDMKVTPNNLLVEHILKEHLPLRCNRCAKVFHTTSDFESITRCLTITDRNGTSATDAVCQLEQNAMQIPTIKEASPENGIVRPQEVEDKENINDNCSVVNSSDYSNGNSGKVHQTAIKVMKASTVTATTPRISKELRAITDPIEEIPDINKAMLTPLSMINLRWKRKSRQSFDSMLCVTSNISAVNASSEDPGNGPPSPNKKLVRTTSTPMMHGCLPHRKGAANESYTSAMGQMSSIHHSNSGSDSDSKAEDPVTSSPASYEILPKVRAISRSRSRAVATPLRQVMSKSIQRAIAQHGYYSKILAPGTQRKMSFNSTNGSSVNSTSDSSLRGAALDLRTTPVLKRASSESAASSGFAFHKTAKMICLPKKSNEESSEARVTFSSYYDTHQSLDTSREIIDQENRDNQRLDEESLIVHRRSKSKTAHNYQDTPKMAGGILKKVITFATPEMSRKSTKDDFDEDGDEVWATPCAVPTRSFSCSAIGDSRFDSIMTEDNSDASGSDDVFMPPSKTKSCTQYKAPQSLPSTGRLWTIVTNVMRLASRGDIQEELATSGSASSVTDNTEEDGKVSSTLLKKAASFAGFLKDRFPVRASKPQQSRNSSSGSEEFAIPYSQEAGAGLKRRRTASLYTRPYEFIGNAAAVHRLTSSSPLAKRAKRIQGRQPIERMRSNSRSDGSGSDI